MFNVKYGINRVGTTEPEKAASILKKYGYDGVEWHPRVRDYLANKKAADELRKEVSKARTVFRNEGLGIISLSPGLLLTDIQYDGLYELAFELAGKLETDKLRLFPSPYVRYGKPPSDDHAKYSGKRTYHELYKETIECLGKVVKAGKGSNIRTVLETHDGYIGSSPSLVYNIVSKFQNSEVGVLFDPENMLREGREGWRMSFELLGDYLSYFHLKDGGWTKEGNEWKYNRLSLGDGLVNYLEVFGALKKVGFSGYFCIEDIRQIPIQEKLSSIKTLREIVEKAQPQEVVV